MAMVLLVATSDAGEPLVGPEVADRLGCLGITRLALLRDTTSTAVILEGWAFDPIHIDEAARAVFPDGMASVRTFHEIEYVGVSASHRRRRT